MASSMLASQNSLWEAFGWCKIIGVLPSEAAFRIWGSDLSTAEGTSFWCSYIIHLWYWWWLPSYQDLVFLLWYSGFCLNLCFRVRCWSIHLGLAAFAPHRQQKEDRLPPKQLEPKMAYGIKRSITSESPQKKNMWINARGLRTWNTVIEGSYYMKDS